MAYFQDDDDPRLITALREYDENRDVQAEYLLRPLAAEGNLTAMFKLGNVFSRTGREQKAEELWTIAASVGDARAINNVGTVRLSEGREEEALALFMQAADRGNREAAFNAANILEGLGREPEFIAILELLGQGGWGRAWGRLGLHYLEQGDQAAVIKAMTAFGYGIKLGSATCNLGMAVEAQKRDDYEGVRRWAERALECTFDEHEEATGLRYQAHGIAAAAYLSMHDYDAGVHHLAEAAKGGDPEVHVHLEQIRELISQLESSSGPEPPATVTAAPSINPGVSFCPYCGQSAETSHAFCAACGQSLPK